MKIIRIFYYFIISLLPAIALAQVNEYDKAYKTKENVRLVTDAIKNDPSFGMAFYGGIAVAAFVGLIAFVFILIMFLKR
jgi:hypothetical protein